MKITRRILALVLAVVLGGLIGFNVPVFATSPGTINTSSDGFVDANAVTYAGVEAGTLTASNSDVFFVVGQSYESGTYSIDRGYLSFDTSFLGASANITGAQIIIKGMWDYSTTDFTIQLQTSNGTYPHNPIVTGDFASTNYSGNGGTWSSADYAETNTINLNSTGIGWINKTGTSKFALRSQNDINGITPTGYELIFFSSLERGIGYIPQLVVYYSLPPTITAKSATNLGLNSAKLNSTLDSLNVFGNDTTASIRFGYGTTSQSAANFLSYGNVTAWVPGNSIGNPFLNVTGLTSSQVYYYRVQAKNDLDGNLATSTAEITFNTNDGLSILRDYSLSGSTSTAVNPDMPVQMYRELDVSKIPGGSGINEILAESSTPPALWWFPFIFGIVGILGLLLYGLTAKGGADGSLLVLSLVIEGGLVLFGIMGTNGGSVIPFFPAFLFPIPAIAVMISKKHYQW